MKYEIILLLLTLTIIFIPLVKNKLDIIEINSFFESKNIIDKEAYIKNRVLNKEECQNIINIGNKYSYDLSEEIVDNKPLYQIDIFTDSNKICNKELWNFIIPIYKKKIIPLTIKFTKNIYKLELDFLFFRKYNSKERKDISIHTDGNELSVNILLSNRSDYNGGDFYIFNNKLTNKYMNYYEKKLSNNEYKKSEFIKSFKKLPIVDMSQGDVIIYKGETHLHGVLPVTSGTRYILSFFFNKVK